MGVPEWNEPAYAGETGVDHLGMRVAGEIAYAQFVDFTTTVSWRPRYFSFWCSALRRAFFEAGGREDEDESKIDVHRWRSILKRQDYAIAAATLFVDREARRIAGSDQVRQDLAAGSLDDDARRIPFTGSHLGAATGSLSIYLGPMLQVGLLRTDGVVHRPRGVGVSLADAFDASLAAGGVANLLSADDATLRELRTLGDACGLTMLGRDDPATDHERAVLRDAIVPPVHHADEQLRRRALTIGIILSAVRQSTAAIGLEEFREYVLLDGTSPAFQAGPSFPSHFESARAAWRTYQAHAYATYGLEALFAGLLSILEDTSAVLGDGVPAETARKLLLRRFETGALDEDPLSVGAGWAGRTVEAVVGAVAEALSSGSLSSTEPQLRHLIAKDVRRGRVLNFPRFLVNALSLTLLSILRLRRLEKVAPDSWHGARTSWRLPPTALIAALESAISSGATVLRFFEDVVERLVLRQHRSNALRKLEANPKVYTARFLIEEDRLVLVGRHRPGTSNPRFENAVSFLQGLGYLASEGRPRLTEAGTALLTNLWEGP